MMMTTKPHNTHQSFNNSESATISNENFSIAIRFSDTGEVIELPNVSKFWTVGDVSRRVLKIRNKMQEQKMALPGIYFPSEQERIVMKFKDDQRLCTLSSMESALKQNFFYSPARDEIEEDDQDAQHHKNQNETSPRRRNSSERRTGQRRNSLLQPTASSASKSLFSGVSSPPSSSKAPPPHSSFSPTPPPSVSPLLTVTKKNQTTSTLTTAAKTREQYGATYKSPYSFMTDSARTTATTTTTKRTIGGQQDESQYFRFHRASDFANERLNGNRSDVNGDGPWSPPSSRLGASSNINNNNNGNHSGGFAERRKIANAGSGGSSSSANNLASTSSAIRLSLSGQYFNDPHQCLEELGITLEATMKRKRAGEGSLIRIEAEIVQNLIFGRAIVKRV